MALGQRTSARLIVVEAEGRPGGASDGTQQRRDSFGPLLQARFAEGPQLCRGARTDVSLLRRQRHRSRALRQSRRGDDRRRVAGARRTAPPRNCEWLEWPTPPVRRPNCASLEPHVAGIAGLFVAETGIVDYKQVAESYGKRIRDSGGDIRLDARVTGFRRHASELTLQTTQGEFTCRGLVNCAGLQSDRVARLCGVEPGLQIVPFRGEYYDLVPERWSLVRNLIYPVPDPRFPFLGVHFTRMIHGGVEAGPNAVLAFRREGYSRGSFRTSRCHANARLSGFLADGRQVL